MHSKTPKIFLAVIITALIVGGGVYLWQRKQTAQVRVVDQSLQQTQQDDWLTYEHPSRAFSIQYPSEWRYSDAQGAPDPTLVGWVYFFRNPAEQSKGFDHVSVRTFSEKGTFYTAEATKTDSITKESDGRYYVLNYEGNNYPEETKRVFEKMTPTFQVLQQ